MLSYDKWKKLNESFMGQTTLGLAKHTSVGVIGSTFDEAKKMKKKMLDMPSPEEDEDEDVSDEEGEDIDVSDDSSDDECAGKFCGKAMKKKSKKEAVGCDKDDDDHDHGDDEEAAEEDEEGGDEKVEMPFMKKKMKGKDKKKKHMTKEEQEWWSSFQSMMDSDPHFKHWDGMSMQEDILLPPTNDGLVYKTPEPGEAGFAPQQRMGVEFTPADSGWKY